MGLTETEEKALQNIKRAIEKAFPGELERMLVFGSKARGTASEDSDVDLLVVVNSDERVMQSQLRRLIYSFDVDFSLNISVHIMTRKHFAFINNKQYSFARNIERNHTVV